MLKETYLEIKGHGKIQGELVTGCFNLYIDL